MRFGKLAKSKEELRAIIVSRISAQTGRGCALNVIIAHALHSDADRPNWRVAFTTGGRRAVPSVAWRIGSQVAEEFDLA